ncbi:unnamed protein product [Nezara viridula]|uniref:Cytosol aminopeptidase domain-containing protein n=1 Tax=Nezara viridula TaxID=85310 RepID=A0A9P0H4J2_NEZVI|nr:unnamed protein product [Nezara viridula]
MSLGYELHAVESLNASGYDAILLISHNGSLDETIPQQLRDVVKEAAALDAHLEEEISVIKINLPAKRLIYSPTGPINSEYHDVRSFGEAARKGIIRAVKAGVKSPLLVLGKYSAFPQAQLVSLLGVMEGLYMNLQLREDCPSKFPKVRSVGVLGSVPSISRLLTVASALESGRLVARDIGAADPERMTPKKAEDYLREAFPGGGNVKMEVISDESTMKAEYPLFAAVNRAASVIDRHKGRIVYLTYEGSNVTDTLLIVGKGVTFDSGGADVKVGGNMIGMSKDKCGAASVAGFMKLKELAPKLVNPHLFTVATLTGHAFRTVGPGYTIILDNGPARMKSFSFHLQKSGELTGDMFEVSTIRREDYEAYKGKVEGEDVLQAEHLPFAQSKRGHQGPAAFLVLASGLDKHALGTEIPLKFTHVDVAASSGIFGAEIATGAPIIGFATHFLNLKDKDF